MKKVTFAILTVGVALFASCSGNNAEAEKAKELADSTKRADSVANAEAAAAAAADSAAAAAAATAADTSKTTAATATEAVKPK